MAPHITIMSDYYIIKYQIPELKFIGLEVASLNLHLRGLLEHYVLLPIPIVFLTLIELKSDLLSQTNSSTLMWIIVNK